VKQTTQIVVLQPPAATLLVASHVRVWLDTVEMDVRVKVSHIKILTSCYLSHSYIRYKIHHVVSVCLSVCVSALSRLQRLTDFDEIWHRRLEPDMKKPSRWGSKSNKGIPYFYPILAKIGTYLMHFQTEC